LAVGFDLGKSHFSSAPIGNGLYGLQMPSQWLPTQRNRFINPAKFAKISAIRVKVFAFYPRSSVSIHG
jgi:hypothetical protein